MKQVLTDRTLRALKPAPAGKRVVIWDAALPSFGVRVTDTGKASFFVMRRRRGDPKPLRTVIGTYPSISLVDARTQAREALADLSAGLHPVKRKAAQRAAEASQAQSAVERVAEEFIRRHASRKRTGVAIGQLIRREVVVRWRGRSIGEITRGDVIRLIEEIAESSPSAARQTWIYTQRLFGWALNRDTYGLAAGQFPLDPFVRLLAVLGCRRGELAGMRRGELDLAAGLWHLPGNRTKNEEPRTLPLPCMAVEILSAVPSFPGPYVFTTTSGERPISGFAKLKARLDRRLDEEAPPGLSDWTFHDLRRTMRTHLSALPIAGTVAELMIGHKQRGIRAVYDRYQYLEEQRAGFELWASRLRGIVAPAPENVTPLRRVG